MPEVLFKCKFEVPRHSSKKNEKRIGFKKSSNKPFILRSSKAKFVEDWIVKRLVVERLRSRIEKIECDVVASFILTYPKSVYYTKQGHRSNRVLDLSNSVQVYEDALTKSGVIVDDRIICSLDGSTRLAHDQPSYFIEIILTRAA